MKSITIRTLRQRWPEAEKALQLENEILITRDGLPVAKLVRIDPELPKRRSWDPEEHAKWQQTVSGGKITRVVDAALAKSRSERKIIVGKRR